ncbi:MarR family winged helix-turn-helix transcriptional regulator [Paraburkholderia phytofirmans]
MLHEGYGFVFTRAARFISRIYNRHLAKDSLTVGQYGILVSIANSGPILLQDLADQLVIERSALLRTVKPLLHAGLIQSTADPAYKKRLLYQLADEGRRLIETASASIRSAETEIEGIFPPSTIQTMRNDLLAITNACRQEVDSIV